MTSFKVFFQNILIHEDNGDRGLLPARRALIMSLWPNIAVRSSGPEHKTSPARHEQSSS